MNSVRYNEICLYSTRVSHEEHHQGPKISADKQLTMIFRKKKKKTQEFKVKKWDPLFIIFEKHLYDFNYESRELFVKAVVDDYIGHLLKQKVAVHPMWKNHLEKSLAEEVSDMLVRKLYGCLTVEEFKAKIPEENSVLSQNREARKRYQKLVG